MSNNRTLSLLKIWTFGVILSLLFWPSYSIPEESKQGTQNRLTGEIALEVEAPKKDPYLQSQENTLNYFKNVKSQLLSVSTTGQKLILPDANSVQYLAGLYLFCTLKRGTCPVILEAIFEVDLVNSKLSNSTVCPLMKSFWKQYIENDFEDRLKFGMSTGFVAKVNEFNSKERPKYVRCEETLKNIFSDGSSASALFKNRYTTQGRPLRAIDEVINLINKVAENNINVFVATGAQ